MYKLRSNTIDQFLITKTKSKYGDLIFGNLFGYFCNSCFPFILSYNIKQFKCFVFSDFNVIVDQFVSKFPKFNVNYDFFFYK